MRRRPCHVSTDIIMSYARGSRGVLFFFSFSSLSFIHFACHNTSCEIIVFFRPSGTSSRRKTPRVTHATASDRWTLDFAGRKYTETEASPTITPPMIRRRVLFARCFRFGDFPNRMWIRTAHIYALSLVYSARYYYNSNSNSRTAAIIIHLCPSLGHRILYLYILWYSTYYIYIIRHHINVDEVVEVTAEAAAVGGIGQYCPVQY